MKQAFLVMLALPLVLVSCKERGPFIDFSTAVAKDTTYTAAVEAPQLRNVFIEEFSGIKCSNCPEGHQFITSIEGQHPGRIVAATLHMFNNPLAENRPEISPIDFRTNEATQIDHDVYGTFTTLPFAGIDRAPYNSSLVLARGDWSVFTTSRLSITPPVNLSITSAYDAGSKTAVVKVSARYTSAVTKKQLLSLMLTEDNIDAPQDYVDTNGFAKTYTNYLHKNILHKMYTPAGGSAVLDSMTTKAPGRVYERIFIIDISGQAWKPENCKLVAFIHNNEPGDKEIQQTTEAPLK